MFKTRYRASYKGIIIPCHRTTPALRCGSRQPQSGRQRTACCDDGVGWGLCVWAAACRGGGIEILSRISCCAARSFVISFVISLLSCLTLCRISSILSYIALSCCGSGEVAADATMFGGTAGGVCTAAACGANQLSCGDDFAIISRAASP